MVRKRILIIGAGAAGSAAAQALHQAEQDVDVIVVGAEDRLPYNRTTVNKGFLSGAVNAEDITLPGMDTPAIDWRIGRTALSLEPATRTVELNDGTTIAADAVLLAPGARPRSLPGSIDDESRSRVLSLRTIADTLRLQALLESTSRRVLIAGAGLIGTETAGILLAAGTDVTLISPSPLPMQNHVGITVAEWIADAHVAAGVDFRAGTTVGQVQTLADSLRVDFEGGGHSAGDIILVCLGVVPATEWLRDSGITLQEGTRPGAIMADEHQRVDGMTGIYAAGDAAAAPGANGLPARIEHWGAAMAQGRAAAATILADLEGQPSELAPAAAPTSYSTYVHGTKLTVVGAPSAGLREQAIIAAPGAPRFALAFFDAEDRITGAVGVGGARAVNQLRPFIARGATSPEVEMAIGAETARR